MLHELFPNFWTDLAGSTLTGFAVSVVMYCVEHYVSSKTEIDLKNDDVLIAATAGVTTFVISLLALLTISAALHAR
jgi:cation transporter-like permease